LFEKIRVAGGLGFLEEVSMQEDFELPGGSGLPDGSKPPDSNLGDLKLPEGFEEKMRSLLGSEADAYFASMNAPRLHALRANLLKVTPEELKKLLPNLGQRVMWCPEGFYYMEDRPAKSPYYQAGLFYIQEPSAMAPVSAADIRPGHAVLDMCAAPGGKSTHAAGKLQGEGVLVANDISFTRSKALAKNLEMCGCKNALISCEKPERLADRFGQFFDRILLDAPCSGEGMFRKDPDALKSWSAHKPAQCSALQRSLLFQAQRMLKPGGRIIYSTCTFDKSENELMIQAFLENSKDLFIREIDAQAFGFSEGFPEAAGSARLWPHRQKGEGHFVCAIEKSGESEPQELKTQPRPVSGIELFLEFCASSLNISINGRLERNGDVLCLVPQGVPSLDGIRLARSGWRLGEFKTKRFEPSQALAMALKMGEAKRHIQLSNKDAERYLKGESFDCECDDGWALAAIGEYPLGWAKVQDGRMKNKYLKGWISGL
jgi:NOL1/NOP2/sun family putative RNA methylase